jgi:hypothetical protein
MPRFEPSVEKSHSVILDILIAGAEGRQRLPVEKLTAQSRILLALIAECLARGATAQELRTAGALSFPDPDEHIAEALSEWVRELGFETARVFCVSVDADNGEMWTHYAANGTGAVFGFRHIPSLSTPLLAAREVFYSEEPPVVAAGTDFLLYGNTAELRRRTFDAIFFAKKAEWSYQREWRAITWRHEGPNQFGDYPFYPDELESVTCGVNSSSKFRLEIGQLVRNGFPNCHFVP